MSIVNNNRRYYLTYLAPVDGVIRLYSIHFTRAHQVEFQAAKYYKDLYLLFLDLIAQTIEYPKGKRNGL